VIELRSGDDVIRMDPPSGGRIASAVLAGAERLVTAGDGPLAWGCYPMVPWAGRVRHGRFWHRGRSYRLAPGLLGVHSIHGTGFVTPWTVDTVSLTSVSLSTDLGPLWPFAGTAHQTIVLGARELTCRLSVDAPDEPFPAQVGWHPWFVRPVVLDVAPAVLYRRDHEGLPDGRLVTPPARPWDDCVAGLPADPVLHWPDGCAVTISSSCDHWVIYDEPTHALCVEPQSGPPDAITLAPVLAEPGRPVDHTMTWRW